MNSEFSNLRKKQKKNLMERKMKKFLRQCTCLLWKHTSLQIHTTSKSQTCSCKMIAAFMLLMTPHNQSAKHSAICRIRSHWWEHPCHPILVRTKKKGSKSDLNAIQIWPYSLNGWIHVTQTTHVICTAMLCESHAMSGIALVWTGPNGPLAVIVCLHHGIPLPTQPPSDGLPRPLVSPSMAPISVFFLWEAFDWRSDILGICCILQVLNTESESILWICVPMLMACETWRMERELKGRAVSKIFLGYFSPVEGEGLRVGQRSRTIWTIAFIKTVNCW